jgi:hypothetical protein
MGIKCSEGGSRQARPWDKKAIQPEGRVQDTYPREVGAVPPPGGSVRHQQEHVD